MAGRREGAVWQIGGKGCVTGRLELVLWEAEGNELGSVEGKELRGRYKGRAVW